MARQHVAHGKNEGDKKVDTVCLRQKGNNVPHPWFIGVAGSLFWVALDVVDAVRAAVPGERGWFATLQLH